MRLLRRSKFFKELQRAHIHPHMFSLYSAIITHFVERLITTQISHEISMKLIIRSQKTAQLYVID